MLDYTTTGIDWRGASPGHHRS